MIFSYTSESTPLQNEAFTNRDFFLTNWWNLYLFILYHSPVSSKNFIAPNVSLYIKRTKALKDLNQVAQTTYQSQNNPWRTIFMTMWITQKRDLKKLQ